MVQRIPVRVRRVVDGVLYDSETASTIHYWDDSFLVASARIVLDRPPAGTISWRAFQRAPYSDPNRELGSPL